MYHPAYSTNPCEIHRNWGIDVTGVQSEMLGSLVVTAAVMLEYRSKSVGARMLMQEPRIESYPTRKVSIRVVIPFERDLASRSQGAASSSNL